VLRDGSLARGCCARPRFLAWPPSSPAQTIVRVGAALAAIRTFGSFAPVALVDLTSRDAVLAAMEEFDSLGRDQFLQRYGFGRARDYEVVHDGGRYDSKAIVGAAHGHQHPSLGPLRSSDFSGGQPTISKLTELGFDIEQIDHSTDMGDRTGARLERFLELYPAARQVPFTGEHEADMQAFGARAHNRKRVSRVFFATSRARSSNGGIAMGACHPA
jgi:hypothetical protein